MAITVSIWEYGGMHRKTEIAPMYSNRTGGTLADNHYNMFAACQNHERDWITCDVDMIF
jgi:hypothetical protein